MRAERAGEDRGQAVPVVVGLLAVAVVLLLALVPLAQAAQQRTAARNAADAAALAGAAAGEEAARDVAIANGASLVAWRAEGSEVWVIVELGGARAEAKARRDP